MKIFFSNWWGAGLRTALLAAPLLALLLPFGGAQAQNAPAKKYPPYPDIWGREMPTPAGRRFSSTGVYDFGNGDFLLILAHGPSDPKLSLTASNVGWARMEFFGGNSSPISVAELDRFDKLYKRAPIIGILDSDLLRLPLGHRMKFGSREFGGANCSVNYATTMNLLNDDDKIVATRMVMWLHKEPVRRPYWRYCGPPDGGPDHYFAKVDSLAFSPYYMRDETFLARGYENPFVIRFRPDLTSPFIDKHPNLFIVETAIIDRIVRRVYGLPGFRVQNANDALQEYLLKLQRKKETSK